MPRLETTFGCTILFAEEPVGSGDGWVTARGPGIGATGVQRAIRRWLTLRGCLRSVLVPDILAGVRAGLAAALPAHPEGAVVGNVRWGVEGPVWGRVVVTVTGANSAAVTAFVGAMKVALPLASADSVPVATGVYKGCPRVVCSVSAGVPVTACGHPDLDHKDMNVPFMRPGVVVTVGSVAEGGWGDSLDPTKHFYEHPRGVGIGPHTMMVMRVLKHFGTNNQGVVDGTRRCTFLGLTITHSAGLTEECCEQLAGLGKCAVLPQWVEVVDVAATGAAPPPVPVLAHPLPLWWTGAVHSAVPAGADWYHGSPLSWLQPRYPWTAHHVPATRKRVEAGDRQRLKDRLVAHSVKVFMYPEWQLESERRFVRLTSAGGRFDVDDIVHGDPNDPRCLTLVKVGRITTGMCDDFIVAPVQWASFPTPAGPLTDSDKEVYEAVFSWTFPGASVLWDHTVPLPGRVEVPVVALGKMMRFTGKAPPAGPHLEDLPAPVLGCGHRLTKLGEPVTVGEAGRLRLAARVLLFAAL